MIGTRLGSWILREEIGHGLRGTVYKAVSAAPDDRRAPAVAAVKVFTHPSTREPAFLDRFPADMLPLRRLTHPNIARLFESGVQSGLAYSVSEFVDGVDLLRALAKTERSPEQPGLNWQTDVFRIIVQVARALKHAHHRSLVHRDLKPSNIILRPDGTVQVTDFGLSKVVELAPLTLPGDGSAGYLAPEHFRGKPLTRRSDLYALGGVAYTALTGRPPFTGGSAAELMHKHCYTLPERPANLVSKLPHELDEFVCGLLAKDPNRRPASAAAVLDELDQLRARLERKGWRPAGPPDPVDPTGQHAPLTSEIEAGSADVYDSTREADRRRRAILFGTLLAIVVGLIVFIFTRPKPEPQTLWDAVQPLLASDDPDDWGRARDDYLDPLTTWHPDWRPEDVRRAKQRAKDWKQLHDSITKGGKQRYGNEAERAYIRGLRLAQMGDTTAAARTWQAVVVAFANDEPDDSTEWVALARRGLQLLQTVAVVAGPLEKCEEFLARVRKLRSQGQTKQADDLLAALVELYRYQPEIADRLRAEMSQ